MTTPRTALSVRRLPATLLLTALIVACGPQNPPTNGGGDPPAVDDGIVGRFDFQPASSTAAQGYTADTGAAYDEARGWGWISEATVGGARTPLDLSANTRERAVPGVDARLNSMIHMQYSGTQGNTTAGAWEYKLPNGTYTVTVAVGDAANNVDSKHVVNVEGQPAVSGFTPTATEHFDTRTVRVAVSDGRLTVDAKGGTNTKLDYVIVAAGDRPSVASFRPDDAQTDVDPNGSIAADLNLLPANGDPRGSGVDQKTLTASTVRLTNDATGQAVPTVVNTSGGGDVIVAKAQAALTPNTKYRLTITAGVKDALGNAFLPTSTTFIAGAATPPGPASFAQSDLTNVPVNAYTSVEIGPDNRLYAATLDGKILRFAIDATTGQLGAPEVLTGLQKAQGNRTIIGMKFDPSSTADNLVVWISNNYYWDFKTTPPDYSGKITRLSGPNLDTVQDYVTGLPRSARDHMTNSVSFRPGENNALYVLQGSNSAMGAPDNAWGQRTERLLNAALLRLDLSKLNAAQLPLNVITREGGGTYDPYAPGAPLTFYATGIRNAYDMAWHTNGQLYVPTNGSAATGNTPAGNPGDKCADGSTYQGPAVPAVNNASTQNDYLFRVDPARPVGYFGHPNPLRCQFVANGGNPTNNPDPAEVVDEGPNKGYSVGVMPDKNYRGFAYNFGLHASSNGVIEEYNRARSTTLNNTLLVVRYSVGKDIIALTPGSNFDIVSAQTGIAGLGNFGAAGSPLDLIENRANGDLYVALLNESNGQGTIKLARPK